MALYGIPYQGSKGKFAPMILRAIEQRLPTGAPRILLDPFCGGYAVSHCFHEAGWQTIASDLDRYTVALLVQVLTDGLPESAVEAWVTRAEFVQARDEPDALGMPDWFVGFVRQAWSFGNGGTSYVYGAHLEESKRLIHELVVDGATSARLAEITGVSLRNQARVAAIADRRKRRIAWGRLSARAGAATGGQAKLQAASAAARMVGVRQQSSERTGQILDVQYVLQPMQRAEQITVARGAVPRVRDYRDALADAPAGAVIYLDPPYRDTAGYVAGAFDSDELWRQAEGAARAGHQVYVSEYTAPPEWSSVLSFSRPNTMAADSAAKSTSKAREHLFTYRGASA